MLRRNVIGAVGLGLAGALCTTFMLLGSVGDARVADAAMHGDKDAVHSLLKQAVDVNAAQGDGMTALHWAALNGDAELAQTLIYAGANVKAMTRIGGYTPLYMASKAGNSAVIDVLLKGGSDPKIAAVDGLTPLMMAAVSGDSKSVQLLLDHGADANAKESENGETAMSFAAAFNRPDAIKVLAKSGADINQPSKIIEPAPATPARGAQGAVAAAPIPAANAPAPAVAGGEPAAAAAGGGRGGRGARGAAAGAAPAGAPAVAGGAAPPVANAAGAAAAAMNNGADAGSKGGGNPKGLMTPLMFAARQGSLAAAEALVESGAKLNAQSGDKNTALLLATINGHFDIAKLLVDHSADVSIPSIEGATPLYGVVNTQWARKSFHPQPTTKYEKTSYLDLINDLLNHGADPNAKLTKELWYSEYNFSLESASAVGTTAFWKCAEVGDIDGMRLLVSRGADPNDSNNSGITALLMASGAGVHGNDDVTTPYGRMASVRYLVEELHLDVNAADTGAAGGRAAGPDPAQLQQYAVQAATSENNGKTPTEAQIAEQLKLLQQQVQQGGFGGGRAGGGVTALHNAAARGDNEMILYLVAHGAKVDAVSNAGQTVVDAANGPRQRIQPYPETVALLEMLGAMNNHKCVAC